jgi:hypothetical protein
VGPGQVAAGDLPVQPVAVAHGLLGVERRKKGRGRAARRGVGHGGVCLAWSEGRTWA